MELTFVLMMLFVNSCSYGMEIALRCQCAGCVAYRSMNWGGVSVACRALPPARGRAPPQLSFVWFCKRLNPFNYKRLVKCNCSTPGWIWSHFCFPGWLSAFRPQIAAVTTGAWLRILSYFSLLKREESYLRSSVTMSRDSNPER